MTHDTRDTLLSLEITSCSAEEESSSHHRVTGHDTRISSAGALIAHQIDTLDESLKDIHTMDELYTAAHTIRILKDSRYAALIHELTLYIPFVLATIDALSWATYGWRKWRKYNTHHSTTPTLTKDKKSKIGWHFVTLGTTSILSITALAVASASAAILITAATGLRTIRMGYLAAHYRNKLRELDTRYAQAQEDWDERKKEDDACAKRFDNNKFSRQPMDSTTEQELNEHLALKSTRDRFHEQDMSKLTANIKKTHTKYKRSIESTVVAIFTTITLITCLIAPPVGIILAASGFAALATYSLSKLVTKGYRHFTTRQTSSTHDSHDTNSEQSSDPTNDRHHSEDIDSQLSSTPEAIAPYTPQLSPKPKPNSKDEDEGEGDNDGEDKGDATLAPHRNQTPITALHPEQGGLFDHTHDLSTTLKTETPVIDNSKHQHSTFHH